MPTFRLTPETGGVTTVTADESPGPEWVEIHPAQGVSVEPEVTDDAAEVPTEEPS